MVNKVIGIVSYLPSDFNRQNRKNRFLSLLAQLNHYWPELPIIIIAQNWGQENIIPPKYIEKIDVFYYDKPLGILKARQLLREKFLETNYEQLIMFDDDAIIATTDEYAQKFIQACDDHPKGFMFLKGHRRDPLGIYDPAQLNGCCISRWLIEAEPIRDEWDPQKYGIFEDVVYAHLFHWKYPEYEFDTIGLACVQWSNPKYPLKSTWVITDKQCVHKTALYLQQLRKDLQK